ncbi:MAG: hypothetical protein ACRDZ8_17245 [Acidimicrobiales bacterium]
MTGSGSVAEAIDGWRPRLVGVEAAGFARSVVAAAGPSSVARARALLFACSRVAAFAASVGLELRPEVVLHPATVERYIATATAMSAPTRRTVRTNVRHVAARVGPLRPPRPAVLPRERAKDPYTTAEVAAFLALADTQPTPRRKMAAAGLVCLAAGAGLTGVDLRTTRGVDIGAAGGGLVVTVAGPRARTVPVLARYRSRLEEVAGFFAEAPVVGGADPNRRNVTTPLIASLCGGGDLPRLQLGRLRATWLAEAAAAIGLQALMAAAGVDCSQRLGDIAAALPPITLEESVALLGGVS